MDYCDSLWVTAGSVRNVTAASRSLDDGILAHRAGVFSWRAEYSNGFGRRWVDLTVSFTPSKCGSERAARKDAVFIFDSTDMIAKMCCNLLHEYFMMEGTYDEYAL